MHSDRVVYPYGNKVIDGVSVSLDRVEGVTRKSGMSLFDLQVQKYIISLQTHHFFVHAGRKNEGRVHDVVRFMDLPIAIDVSVSVPSAADACEGDPDEAAADAKRLEGIDQLTWRFARLETIEQESGGDEDGHADYCLQLFLVATAPRGQRTQVRDNMLRLICFSKRVRKEQNNVATWVADEWKPYSTVVFYSDPTCSKNTDEFRFPSKTHLEEVYRLIEKSYPSIC